MDKTDIVKKFYSKPNVEFVNFSLAGSIAATCVYQGTETDVNTCGYTTEDSNGWTFFAQDICDIAVGDKEFCYHVPTEDISVFGS